MLNRILLWNLKCYSKSSPFSHIFPASDEGCVAFAAPSFEFLLKALPLREGDGGLSCSVLEATLYGLYSL